MSNDKMREALERIVAVEPGTVMTTYTMRLIAREALAAQPAVVPEALKLCARGFDDAIFALGFHWRAPELKKAAIARLAAMEALATPTAAVLTEVLVEWLRREMATGTVIANPDWWAPRIAHAMLAATPEPKP